MSASRKRRPPARRIGRWLYRLSLALLLLVGAALMGLFSFEQYTLRPLLEQLAESATGRTLSIADGLDVSPGRIVTVRAGGIRLANSAWGSSDSMLSIDRAEISVDLSRLLEGMPAVGLLLVSGVHLLVEEDEDGRSNWAMASPGAGSAPATDDRGAPTLPVARSELTDIGITVKSSVLARPLRIHLESAGHDARHENELRVSANGTVDDRRLSLNAAIGPIPQLLAAGAVEVDIEAEFEAVTLEAEARLDELLAPRRVSAQVTLVSADTAQVLRSLRLPESLGGASRIEAALVPAGDHHRVDLAASTDAFNLDARARLQSLRSLDGASLTLSAGGTDLAAVAALAGLEGLPARTFSLESSLSLSGEQLTLDESHFYSGDSHLGASGIMRRFPSLQGSSFELQLDGKNYLEYAELLGMEKPAGLPPQAFDVTATLEYSGQDLQQFSAQARIADVKGEFSGELSSGPAFVGTRLDYRIEGRNDALIQQLLGRPIPIDGGYTLEGKFERTPGGFDIEHAALSFGANELQLGGVIADDPLRGDSDLSLRFHGPDLDKIAAVAGYRGFVPAGDASIEASARTQDDAIRIEAFSAELGRNRLQASGLVSLQPGADGSRAQVEATGEDIVDILPPDLVRFVDPRQSFEFTATLATDSGQVAIDTLRARLGEVSLEASGRVSATRPLADSSLQVNARGPDLAAFVPAQLLPYRLPAKRFSVSGGVAIKEKLVRLAAVKAEIGADRLELSGSIPLDTPSDGLDLAISASGPDLQEMVPLQTDRLRLAHLPYEAAGNLQLARGFVALRGLEFSTPRGRLSGNLRVALAQPGASGDFDLEARGDNLAEFLPSLPGFTPAAVTFDLDALGSWDRKKLSIEHGILQLDDARIEARGEVSLPPEQQATQLLLTAQGDSLADLGEFRGTVLQPKEFHVAAMIRSDAGHIEVSELEAQVGDSDLSGSLQVEFADIPQVNIRLFSELLDLEGLIVADSGTVPEDGSEQEPAGDGRLIPQLALPVDQLNRIGLDARILLGELQGAHSNFKNIEIDSTLQGGKLTVRQFQATAAEGQIVASFEAAAEGDRVVTNGTLVGKKIVLGKTGESESGTRLPELDLQLDFDTAGATLRELAANLHGNAKVTGGSGRLANSRTLDLFGSFYVELISLINPFVEREPYTAITCFTAYADIDDGLVEIKPGAVMQTDKLNIFARGQVDLDTERISLRFDTSARRGIGISLADFVNPFVGVTGTLADPGLGVDSRNAMFEGSFAYATGGLSVVAKSLFNRWFGAADPCAKLEQDAQQYLEEKQNPGEAAKAEPQDSPAENR